MSSSPEWKKRTHINGKRPEVNGLPVDEDVEREMRSHLEMMAEELIADGWDRDKAREHALHTFGDLERAKKKQRAITRAGDRRIHFSRFLDGRREDLRYGLRTLRKARGFTLATLLLLALGIGANTAVFSVVYNVMLKPLPYRDSERLALLFEVLPDGNLFGFSPPNFESARERTQVFEDIVAYYPASFTLTGTGDPETLSAMRISAGFFELLGINMVQGRSFLDEEDTSGGTPVTILGHSLWLRLFDGRADVVGESIILSSRAHTIVGVTPADFHFVDGEPDIWVPCAWTGEDKTNRGRHWLQVLGRLNSGTDIDIASTELGNIAAQLSIDYPGTNEGWGMLTHEFHRTIVSGVDTQLLILSGVVGLILLIACANVGNLTLVRAERRSKEMAIRSAIGADRRRIIAQLFTESMLLAMTGGLIGIGLAYAGTGVLADSLANMLPRAAEISVNGSILLFTVCVSLVSGILIGFTPMTIGLKRDLLLILNMNRGAAAKGTGRNRLRRFLGVSEVAMSLVLLIGAGLLLSSFRWLTQRDFGFETGNLLVTELLLPQSALQGSSSPQQFLSIIRDLESLPGVTGVSASETLPFQFGRRSIMWVPERPDADDFEAERHRIMPDYFETIRIPLLSGRTIKETDTGNTPPVIVINEQCARLAFPGENAVGKYLNFRGGDFPDLQIVGVVGNVQQNPLAVECAPCIYFPNIQFYPTNSMHLILRTDSDPLLLVNGLRETIWSHYPDIPAPQIKTMHGIIRDAYYTERLQTVLLSLFAGVALLLCILGIFGVLSFTVSQRTAEFGIRSALGAERSEIIRLVLKQGLTLTLFGIVLGTAGALALSHILSGVLHGITATDPATFIKAGLLLTVISIAAGIPAAVRAASVDPVTALNSE